MDGTILDTWYPAPRLVEDGHVNAGTCRVSARELSDRFLSLVGMDRDRLVELVPVRTSLRSRGRSTSRGSSACHAWWILSFPPKIYIAETERVRLGAYLAPGTSVMREGYVSYNAGSLGPARASGCHPL